MLVNNDKEKRHARLVLVYASGELVIELLEVVVSSVANALREEGPVGTLEALGCPGVVERQQLQPRTVVHVQSQSQRGERGIWIESQADASSELRGSASASFTTDRR